MFKSSLTRWDFEFWTFLYIHFRSIPLGRTLDFLQEDIDMMQKEISKWSDEYDKNVRDLKRQQKYVYWVCDWGLIEVIELFCVFLSETMSYLEPYRSALTEIETQIGEQLEKIASVKRKILTNEEKISRLIFNVGKTN